MGTPLVVTPASPSALNAASLSQTVVKVTQLLEKTLTNDPQNQKVPLEDMCMRVQGRKRDTSHSNCPSPCLLGFLGVLAHLPLSQQTQTQELLQPLRLTWAVSKALSIVLLLRVDVGEGRQTLG